jgi:hypothetical protein
MSPKNKVWVGAGAAIVAVIAIVLLGNSLSSSSSAKNAGSSGNSAYAPQEHRANIVNGVIGVNAQSYQAYPTYAPAGSTNIRVTGSFVASGGTGNDIKVWIVDEQGLTNFKNGHQPNSYYSSGEKTTENINTMIPDGTQLYLIYDNTYSFFSSKQVNTRVDLVYTN